MTASPRILYVDDESDLLELASSFFEDDGLPIETCSTFQEALARASAEKYDLLISDARMPSGSGIELLRRLRLEHGFEGRAILVTGNLDAAETKEAAIFDLVIFKPVQFLELIDAVRGLLKV
jgi:CheY-like chemotaxis protein